jgi:hypothetical protein
VTVAVWTIATVNTNFVHEQGFAALERDLRDLRCEIARRLIGLDQVGAPEVVSKIALGVSQQ